MQKLARIVIVLYEGQTKRDDEMKKLKLIYNPFSGDKSFKNNLDVCIHMFQQAGIEAHIFRSITPGDIDEHLSKIAGQDYEGIAIAGGDGSINIAINAMMKYGIDLPLGIIPAGTANDFATFIKLPKSTEEAVQIICNGKTQRVDIGQVNGKYFINVCAAGLLTNVSQIVDPNIKSAFGKLAYYMKGLEQLPNFMPLPMRITHSRGTIEENLYWFTVLNSAGTGGFERLSPEALIDDGKFDFVGLKAIPIFDLSLLFLKMLKGSDYLYDSNVIFFRDEYIRVEYLGGAKEDTLSTDVDGEIGPDMPIEIKNLQKKMEIFIP